MAEQREILIVDDSEENVVFLSQILEDNGYKFEIARDGKEAMELMREKKPDLVILDVMMPRKSGIGVFQEMKNDPTLQKIPVIVVTGLSSITGVNIKTGEHNPKKTYQDDFERGFGVALHEKLNGLTPDGLIEKPIDPAILGDTIKKLLS